MSTWPDPFFMSERLPGLAGGYGFGFGPWSTVVQDQEPSKDIEKNPKALDPVSRSGLMPYSAYGQFPGFGPFPAVLSIPLMWAMRHYPMVRKVHDRVTKPVLSGTRSIEVEDDGGDEELADEIKLAAEQDLLPILAQAMPGAMESPVFGRWLQEMIWGRQNGRLAPVEIESILPQQGIIHVDPYRRFVGYQVGMEYRDARYGFLSVHDPHLDPVLGHSLNEAALTSWFRSTKSAENADAVERKAAGIQLILHIMQGAKFTDANGKEVNANTMARQWMDAAVKGESVVVPGMSWSKDSIEKTPALADVPVVRADKFDWGNIGPNLEAHLARKRDLDVDICAAWGVPERAVMEADKGGMGTSDAETHSDVVLSISEQLHSRACQQWDKQVTARWMAVNYGNTKVRIKTMPSPLADPQQTFLQGLVTALAQNQQAAPEILANVDKRKLMERVEVPMVSEEEAKQNLIDAQKAQQKQQDQQHRQAIEQITAKGGQPVNGKPANGGRMATAGKGEN